MRLQLYVECFVLMASQGNCRCKSNISISCLYVSLIGDHNTNMTQFITQIEGSVRCSVKKYNCVIEL